MTTEGFALYAAGDEVFDQDDARVAIAFDHETASLIAAAVNEYRVRHGVAADDGMGDGPNAGDGT